jgi:hypothetical protein
METSNYIISHIQPLLGLVTGTIVVLLSAYIHWKIDKKVKAESTLPITSRSMSNPMWRTLSSFGIAFGGIMIIIAIKFLSS